MKISVEARTIASPALLLSSQMENRVLGTRTKQRAQNGVGLVDVTLMEFVGIVMRKFANLMKAQMETRVHLREILKQSIANLRQLPLQ